MKHAETVTFGGSGLDRGQHLRADPQALAALWAGQDTHVLPFWRGQALVEDLGLDMTGGQRLVRLSPAHPVFAAVTNPIFLGYDGDHPCFAADISATLTQTDIPPAGPFATTRQPHPALPQTQGFADLRGLMTGLTRHEAELAAIAKALLDWHRSHSFCANCGTASTPSMGGWQRQCPNCNAPHFPRTDPVVIMLVTQGNSVLLGRSPGWPEGMYSLLAGFIEPGETMESAVRREVFEETAIQIGPVTYLASQPWPFPANLMLGCHAIATSTAITLDPAELEDAIWLTREELAQVFAGLHPRVKASRPGSIAQFILTAWLADTLD